MALKHKISEDQSYEVIKKKPRKVKDDQSAEDKTEPSDKSGDQTIQKKKKPRKVKDDQSAEDKTGQSDKSGDQTIQKKKKPRKIEPFWSTSKSFVAALKTDDKVGAVLNWLQAINQQQNTNKSEDDSTLMKRDVGKSEISQEDIDPKNEDSEKDYEEDGEFQEDKESEQVGTKASVEKFGDIIAPYVDAFFRAGGTVSMLLTCGRLEQSQLCSLFQALYHIMLRGNVLGAIDSSWIKGECIEFLRLNSETTHRLLSTLRSARQNQLTLEFLLAMTAVDSEVAIEVLGIADLKETNVRHMTSDSTINVRKAYINLITGLLVYGDPTLTRALMIKSYIVSSIIPSLVWDPADTVATFLTALRCHLVQNRSILKVKKSEIFSGEILTDLLRLYRWGGPANKPATLAHISKKAKAKSARPFIEVDRSELETVIASVHNLLLVLLSDHTFGLVYKDLSLGTKSQRNYLISHVFRYVEKPWDIPALGELFVRTLIANPDVMKIVLQLMKPSLEPRATKEWSKCMDLVEQVITGIQPEKVIEESLGELSLPHLMSVVVDLCVPQILVGVLCGTNGANLLGSNGGVTHRIAQLLGHMLDNLSKVYDRMEDWREQGKLSQNDVMKVRRFVTEYLIRNFPLFSTMLKSCLAFMKTPDDVKSFDDEASVSSDTSILKLLLSYLTLCSKEDSSVANADGENHKILMEMFDTLYIESEVHPYIRYDFYELLLALKEPSFVIENESTRQHVQKLFCDVLNSDENISRRAKSVLVKLIKNATLFEGTADLPSIWLDIYRSYLRVHDVDLMMESVVRAASNPAVYQRKIEKADEKTIQKLIENERLEESLNAQLDEVCFLFDTWEEEEPVLGTKGNLLCTVSYELNTISPWLPALLEVVAELQETQTSKQLIRRQEFLKHLLVTLLFYSTQPATLIRLVVKKDRKDGILPSDLVEYFKSWGTTGCPQPLFFKDSFVSKLTKLLLVEDAQKLDDPAFLQESMRKELVEDKDKNVARNGVLYLVRVVVFHIVELSQRGMLTSLIAERAAAVLRSALIIAGELRGDVLRNCVQIFLSNFVVFSEFAPSAVHRGASTLNLTSIVVKVLQTVRDLGEVKNDESVISALKEPFKQKFITALETARDLDGKLHPHSSQVVELFHYTFEEITKMLTIACGVPKLFWLEGTKTGLRLCAWGLVIAHLLREAANSKEVASLPDALVTKISENMAALNAGDVSCLSPIEKSFLAYLQFRPQQTKLISRDLLPAIFRNSCPSAESENLAVWLCKRFETDCLEFISRAMTSENSPIFQKRFQLLFQAMKSAFSHLDTSKKAVHFESCVPVIGKLVRNAVTNEEERPKWLASYIDFVVALLAKYKRFSVAKAALFSLLKSPPTVSLEKFFCVELIESLFWSVCGSAAHPPMILLYLRWLTVSLQKQEKSEDDVLLISKLCRALLKTPPESKATPTKQVKEANADKKQKAVTWETVLESETWMTYVPLALMFGLQPTYIENESKGVEARALVLRALCQVCEKNFACRADPIQIATIFKLAMKHSEFESCMTTTGPVRLELVKLLKLLVEFSPTLIDGDHFPTFLTAYKATTDPADRLILQLLDKYESAGVVPPLYKSFLWGQDGASIYATMNEKNSLREYDPNRTFSLLSLDLVHRTVLNYPLTRSLDVHEKYERSSSDGEVYDPAFYLPIFSHVTAPESPLKTFDFVRSGGLALTLVSLASELESVRIMAYSILSGFADHIYLSRGVQVDVLNRFMDSLRVGVTDLIEKDGSSSPRLSSVVAIYLARTCMIICNPLAPMYTTLNGFLLAKVEIDLKNVPEFMACMHACTSDYRDQRTWMLEIIASGLRTESDFLLCFNSEIPVFRLLMDMFTSSVSDVETKVRILKVMTAAVAIPSGASWLVFRSGLLAWLSSVCLFRFAKNSALVSALVTLIRTVWQTLTSETSPNSELPIQTIKTRISCQLLRFSLTFVPMLATMDKSTTCAYLSTVEETYKAGYPATAQLLNDEAMKSMIELSSSTLSKDVENKCLSILKYGCDFLLEENEHQGEVSEQSEAAKSFESLTKSWVSLKSTS